MSKTTHKRDRDPMHHEWIVYADPMPHQIPGNPEATPECDAIHDCDWIVYRVNYPADFDGGVAL